MSLIILVCIFIDFTMECALREQGGDIAHGSSIIFNIDLILLLLLLLLEFGIIVIILLLVL